MRRAEVTAFRWQVHADRRPTARRVARALDGESVAADVLWPELQSLPVAGAAHVCIRRMHIAVRLRISQADGDAAIRRRWSLAARDALHETLGAATSAMRAAGAPAAASSAAPGVLVGADGDVVVYRRRHDATIDLVRGLVGADTSRAWAWRQCGVLTGSLPSSPAGRARAIATALTARPALVPAVLAELDAPADLPLDAGLWAAVAEAWAAVTAADTAPSEPGPVPAGPPRGRDPVPSRPAAPPPAPDHVVTAALRSPAGRALAARAPAVRGLPPASRAALARLALASALPHRSRDPQLVAAVAEALAGRRGHPAEAVTDDVVPAAPEVLPVTRDGAVADDRVPPPVPRRDREVGRTEPAPPPPVVATTAEPTVPAVRDGVLPGDEREATRHGGLLFLAWPIGEVVAPDLPPALLPGTIARLCRRLSGAGADDPAVRALAGPLTDDELPPSVADADWDDVVERQVRAWVGTRLRAGGPVRDRPDELDWLWLRPALIETTPGWIEAEFSLADVDLRIRRALLDLDPGWLWWRGAVMRFRYV